MWLLINKNFRSCVWKIQCWLCSEFPFLIQVFGMDKKYWLIPAYSEEDLRRMPALQGLEYPTKPDLDGEQF